MAFEGIHVVCAFAGSGNKKRAAAAILGRPLWSKNLKVPGLTTQSAPGSADNGQPVFDVYSSVDAFVAVGSSPDATVEPRLFIPAKTSRTFYVDNGDKLAWVAA